jgi:hypothetical protein
MGTMQSNRDSLGEVVGRMPLIEEAQASLCEHATHSGAAARARHGPIDEAAITRLLLDRQVVRYPTTLSFNAAQLEPGEFAHAILVGAHPREGYRVYVHPFFADRPGDVAYLVAYHLVTVNYGEIATHEVAETFGAELLGIPRDEYYFELCRLADELAAWQSAEGQCPRVG